MFAQDSQAVMQFWSKSTENGQPGIDVKTHCLNVGWVAYRLAERFEKVLRQFQMTPEQAAFLAAAHDCGKISYDFQTKLKSWTEAVGWVQRSAKGLPHGRYSQDALHRFLIREQLTSARSAAYWAAVVGAHHGRLFGLPDPDTVPRVEGRRQRKPEPDWEQCRRELMQTLQTTFSCNNLPEVSDDSSLLWMIAGLIVLADWIGSDELFFPADHPVNAAEISENALQALQIAPLKVVGGLSFHDIFAFEPNSFQSEVESLVVEPGLYIMEAPMGLGKTEAALWAGYRLLEKGQATGIYFALPTQTTSNRIWERLQVFANRVSPEALKPRLIHGTSWLAQEEMRICADEEQSRTAERWFASSKRALLAPIGVGTVDQALKMVLCIRHFFLYRFALAGKVVVLDEVHSYDTYTSELIRVLVDELIRLGATVIILSATLTERARARLCNSDFKTGENVGSSSVRFTRKLRNETLRTHCGVGPIDKPVAVNWASQTALLEKAVAWAKSGAAVLWICDTVDSAQTIYQRLQGQAELDDADLGLLHARFPLFQRKELERRWLDRLGKHGDRNRGCILVATQIVEQSVDIDADILVTELAPTDMLFQRIGRLQRHNRGERKWKPACWIIAEDRAVQDLLSADTRRDDIEKTLGSKRFVYSTIVLLRTMRAWEKLQTVHVPRNVRSKLEETYESEISEVWEPFEEEQIGERLAMRNLALQASNIWNVQLENDDGAQCSSRLQKYETLSLVLYRAIDETKIVFANGEILLMEQAKSNRFKKMKLLALNTVKINANFLKEIETSVLQRQWMAVFDAFEDLVMLNVGECETGRLQYSEKLGVYRVS